ncbi:hypothetical protein CBR_g4043 [Chara braunii]|uniref:Nuclear pore protein n=1 Tax=Chara braunii TaxID=69332 RepID=A0A388KH29_CHABU|nr:hypothetical protein CBR_g4043 [Chara braunii]|eukprot:GBG69349.1 hypothetical protein CBR_g4043 [Chara braunii]
MAAARSWDDLLQQSQMLVAQGSGAETQFPHIERSLDQLEAISRQLKARTTQIDSTAETTAATRLLAREGIDAERLTRDLRTFELKTTFEDICPVEASTVEEYLQQLHEMTMLSAIQESQKETLQSFEDYISHVAEADWQREKRNFLQSLSRLPSLTPGVASTGIGGITDGGSVRYSEEAMSTGYQGAPYGAQSLQSPTSRGMGTGVRGLAVAASGMVEQSILERKVAAYAAVVERVNAAHESNQDFKVATAFKEAYEFSVGEPAGTRSVTMLKIWRLLQAMLEGEEGGGGGGRGGGGGGGGGGGRRTFADLPRKMQMVIGARKHLEMGHEKHLLDLIQSHANWAGLGGSTGNLQRVRAFLRVRLHDQGPLDFDVKDSQRQPPLDTTWHQIYFCLRTGYYEEARSVAQASRVSRPFAGHLGEWIDRGGAVTPATAAAVTEECERMIRTGERHGKPGYDKQRMLLYVIVSGSRMLGERLLAQIPGLFRTIEDFMWFKLALVRDAAAYGCPGSGPEGGGSLLLGGEGRTFLSTSSSSTAFVSTAAPSAPEPYTLDQLQIYLRQYPDSYYTKNGRDPLVYPYVLLLSLQLHASIVYLFKDHTSEDFRVDAVHIGVALADCGVLNEGPEVERGQISLVTTDAVSDIASIIRQYGMSFARAGDLQHALEYYVAAATAMGGGAASMTGQATREQRKDRQGMLEACLRELLQTYSGVALLLGQAMGVSEGQLRRFVEDESSRRELVISAARECQDRGQYNEAIELYKRAGAFGSALEIVNRKFSEAVGAVVMGKMEGEGRASVMRQVGNQILDLHKTLGTGLVPDRENVADQHAAFRQLEAITDFYRLYSLGKYGDAVREVARLPFLPFDGRSLERCEQNFRHVSRPVEDRLPDVLAAVISCLEGMEQTGSDAYGSVRSLKVKIANFVANSLPRNWPQSLYELVARMHATPGR